MKIKVLKLGSVAKDSATKLKGMLTIMEVRRDLHCYYAFQPRALNPKTGEPTSSFWLTKDRVSGVEEVEMDAPVEVLDTQVTDEASGFSGTAIYLTYHISGCVHVGIQPAGTNEAGGAITAHNFDIRRLSGKAVPQLTEEARADSQKKTPSPSAMPAAHH